MCRACRGNTMRSRGGRRDTVRVRDLLMKRGCFDCTDELKINPRQPAANVRYKNSTLNKQTFFSIFEYSPSVEGNHQKSSADCRFWAVFCQCLWYGNRPAHTVELAVRTADSLLFCCFVWAGARVPAEALVWTAGPSDPSSLLLNWF